MIDFGFWWMIDMAIFFTTIVCILFIAWTKDSASSQIDTLSSIGVIIALCAGFAAFFLTIFLLMLQLSNKIFMLAGWN